MLFISTTHQPASDLGYLLRKNPANLYEGKTAFGTLKVFYPEVSEEKTTAAFVVEIDPIALVRRKEDQGSAEQYVNDRPYTANSYVSVGIAEAFGSAMSGGSKERPELAETPIPISIRIPVLRAKKGEDLIRRIFEPLGYRVEVTALPLDEQFPEWGESFYFDVSLHGTHRLCDSLRHLYVLLPVLDEKKHYYMDKQEVDKILSKGQGWLADHPEKSVILRTSLGRKPSLMREAFEQLSNAEPEFKTPDEEASDTDEATNQPVERAPKKVTLHRQRHDRVTELVRELKPKSIIDLGCGEGKFIRSIIPIQGIEKIVGLELSYYTLERATKMLQLEDGGGRYGHRVELIHGSLLYRDARTEGFDVATVIEVIEHMEAHRLPAFAKVVFGYAKPKTVIVTTPNREYNAVYNEIELRHDDHRFEWTRAEFQTWVDEVCAQYGYQAEIEGIGDLHPEYGCPSQMAVFKR